MTFFDYREILDQLASLNGAGQRLQVAVYRLEAASLWIPDFLGLTILRPIQPIAEVS